MGQNLFVPSVWGATQAALETFTLGLKLDGLWSVFDEAWIAQVTSAATLTGIINGRVATVSGSPVFTPSKGFKGDGVSAFIDTTYNPSTNGVNATQNSNSCGLFTLQTTTHPSGGWDFGQSTLVAASVGGTDASMFARNSSSSSDQIPLQQTANIPTMWSSTRNASTGFNMYYNGAQLFTASPASSGTNVWSSGVEQQGWATDATNYFTVQSGVSKIVKRNITTWASELENATPFAGLTGSGLNHLGDFDIANSKLYVPVANWTGACGAGTDNQIAVYSKTDLTLQQQSAVLSGVGSLAGLAVDTTRSVIYGVDYCDPTVIYRFDLTTLAQLSPIDISVGASFDSFQGVAYSSNYIYVAARNGTSVKILILDLSGNLVGILHATSVSGYEGINFSGANIGWLMDDNSSTALVRFYPAPVLGTTQTIVRTSGAFSSANMTVFKINGGSAFTQSQIAFWYVGGALTPTQARMLDLRVRNYLTAIGAI